MVTSTKWRGGGRRWWPFAALCSLLLLRWNLAETYPQASSTVTSQALGCGAAALACVAGALLARTARPRVSTLLRAGGAGALLLAGPELALLFPGVPVTASAWVIALGLTPIVAVIAVSSRRADAGVPTTLLVPSIAAATGLLLLLPEPNLSNAYADVILLLVPLLTGMGCALFGLMETGYGWWRATAALAGATVVFTMGWICQTAGWESFAASGLFLSWTVIGDALLAILAVLAVGRVASTQYAARFALVPLLALLEGWVLLRLPLTARPLSGLVLVAAGAFGLLRTPSEEAVNEPLSLVP